MYSMNVRDPVSHLVKKETDSVIYYFAYTIFNFVQ